MDRLRYQRLVIAGVLVLVLLIIEIVPRISRVTSPLQYLGGWIGRGFYVTTDFLKEGIAKSVLGHDGKSIIDEQKRLIANLSVDKQMLADLQNENLALKESLVVVADDKITEAIMARIIGHDPNDPHTRLRISAGTSNGLVVGSAVTTPSGILIGVVVDAQERLSTIELLKKPSLTIPVSVPSRPSTFGLLESPDGFSLHITQVPKDGLLEEGDLVVTNVGFRRVPPNLSVGVIGSVREDPESLWKQAQVIPLVDVRSLDYVLILKTP